MLGSSSTTMIFVFIAYLAAYADRYIVARIWPACERDMNVAPYLSVTTVTPSSPSP